MFHVYVNVCCVLKSCQKVWLTNQPKETTEFINKYIIQTISKYKILKKTAIQMNVKNLSEITSVARQQFQLFNKKIKGTFIEKWVKYWKLLAKDYKEVALSVKQEAKDKPIKVTSYITGLGLLYYCNAHNPNLQSFRAKYLECVNNIVLINENLVNRESVNHIRYIDACYNAKLIRYLNLGIASIIWVDNYSDECDVYASQCKYLKMPYSTFKDRILDVGFCNIWWIISRKMLDYDINFNP